MEESKKNFISSYVSEKKEDKFALVDGNTACVSVAYALSEVAIIYPITPSSPMSEMADEFYATGRKNIYGDTMKVTQMQSEAGAAGAVHGSLQMGALTTTFTSSQGLLLMLPNLIKMSGELLPVVLNIAARALAGQALSIFGDHSDVMMVRSSGCCMLSSHNVVEAQDLAIIAHLASMKVSLPFLHFFDGMRTSHENNVIPLVETSTLRDIIMNDKDYQNKLIDFRNKKNLHPAHPIMKGTSQNPDIFFQYQEASNTHYLKAIEIVEQCFEYVGKHIGRYYHIFDYVGHKDATDVVVMMGSGTTAMEEVILQKYDKLKIGLIKVHLYRPWSKKHFLNALPKTVERIAVLDRTKECGAIGEPLFNDVAATCLTSNICVRVIGGRYGLGSKDFSPSMAYAVIQNMKKQDPIFNFTVGIIDDVTNLSLPILEDIDTIPKGTFQALFYGLASDGTVSANKQAIKLISQKKFYSQGYFAYDANKAMTMTISHIRFGPSPIYSAYFISNADYVAINNTYYVTRQPITEKCKKGSILVLNTPWSQEELKNKLPDYTKKDIAQKNLTLYNIDAAMLANQCGLGYRINMIMQAVFFKLSLQKIFDFEESIKLLKESVQKFYGKKGQAIVQSNFNALDLIHDEAHIHLNEVKYDKAQWLKLSETKHPLIKLEEKDQFKQSFINNVFKKCVTLEGDQVPVSAVTPGGIIPMGTTHFEKRSVASTIPIWIPQNCIQCNYCTTVCPHATIVPFLEEGKGENAPDSWATLNSIGGKEYENLRYRIQVAPDACTGCKLCYSACPAEALEMLPVSEHIETELINWDYGKSLPDLTKTREIKNDTVRGAQFSQPLFEFSGACSGCGETPYIKLVTQLFGEKMVIANATGCSSIYGATLPFCPYTTNQQSGRGPAWGNSLFEDAAEYGMGMVLGFNDRRMTFHEEINNIIKMKKSKISNDLIDLFKDWYENYNDSEKCEKITARILPLLEKEKDKQENLLNIYNQRDLFDKISFWVIGGDGWAYDIGYGGLDHVIASGLNINILILDTEVYSNTGGQKSKSTPFSAVSKFAFGGKNRHKKELGIICMQYQDVYVASVSIGGNWNHCLKAFLEAEKYPGTSLILAYAPCIEMGMANWNSVDREKIAVETGYWPLYRYDPFLLEQGKNPFQLDSKRISKSIEELLKVENRFIRLQKNSAEKFEEMQKELSLYINNRQKKYQFLAQSHDISSSETDKSNSILLLYASETGTAEGLSKRLEKEFNKRKIDIIVSSFDDYEYESELQKHSTAIFIASTCGQGEIPNNAKNFFKWLNDPSREANLFQNLNYCVFGLGDSSYFHFCRTSTDLDKRMKELGGKQILDIEIGDDQADDGLETGWEEWEPKLWNVLKIPEPAFDLNKPSPNYEIIETKELPSEHIIPPNFTTLNMKKASILTAKDHDRIVKHFIFDVSKTGWKYQIGDCLAVNPENEIKKTEEFMQKMKFNSGQVIKIKSTKTSSLPAHVPSICTIKQLFVNVLDIFGKPRHGFFKEVAKYSSDPEEQKKLIFIASPEGRTEYDKYRAEFFTYADIFMKFTSITPSVPDLIELIPPIKPRLYSIASSFLKHPSEIHLCVVLNDFTTASKIKKEGLGSSYLLKLNPNTLVVCKLHPSSLPLPSSITYPVIMGGFGTGIAPIRALIQQREMQLKDPKVKANMVGPMTLFFGCRYSKRDYLFQEELEKYAKEGLLQLNTAFSRDQEHKVYVTDRMKEEKNGEMIYDFLFNKNATMYVCGGKGPGKNINKTLIEIIQKYGKKSKEEAEKDMIVLINKGQYITEIW